MSLVHLVALVYLVCLVYLVYLVYLVKPDRPDKPNRPNRPVDYGWDIARRQARRRDIADLFPLPPPGFLWYGHRTFQPVEKLAHVAE